ncbi:hypothetical protein Asi03nite_21370 [Actinoplanes siamensis]|uniref:Uncharacterized protein n=1 Tax=Actinoplanes siamensis TaxID=1223317 RepID=A0A919TJP6_9ACTN|nr:hypothetical protein Asi03nite_21370 [Actinoplanes siamensis]
MEEWFNAENLTIEAIRVLYVAATRARRLFVTAVPAEFESRTADYPKGLGVPVAERSRSMQRGALPGSSACVSTPRKRGEDPSSSTDSTKAQVRCAPKGRRTWIPLLGRVYFSATW